MINNKGYVPDNIYPPFTVKFQYKNSSVSSSINSAAALSLEDPVPCKDVSAGLGRRRRRNRKSLSASISGTSVYRGSKRGRRVVRLMMMPRRATGLQSYPGVPVPIYHVVVAGGRANCARFFQKMFKPSPSSWAVCVIITAGPRSKLFAWRCVCLLLQYLLQSCSRGGGGEVEDMCYERIRAEAYVN